MTTTARALITGSLRLLNYVQNGEVVSADDMAIAISAFDAMIDSWSNDRLMVYSMQPYIFNTVGGQQNYLMGPGNAIVSYGAIVPGSLYTNGTYTNVAMTGGTGTGAVASITVAGGLVTNIQIFDNSGQTGITPAFGYKPGDVLTTASMNIGGTGSGFSVQVATVTPGDWNIIRPMRIEQAYVIWNSSGQTVDIPMEPMNDSQWADITVKLTPSTFPFAFYDDGAYPIKNVSVWPVPTAATPIRLWLRQPLMDFTNLDQQVTFPLGYERAFRFNLAVELAAEFGKAIPPEVASVAVTSHYNIAKMNAVPQYMKGDGGLGAGRRPWNYISGGFVAGSRF